MKKYTKDEFFDKMEWEGGFESMAGYSGGVEITDDNDLHAAWNAFAAAYLDLQDIYDDWEASRPIEDDD